MVGTVLVQQTVPWVPSPAWHTLGVVALQSQQVRECKETGDQKFKVISNYVVSSNHTEILEIFLNFFLNPKDY